MSLVFGDSTGDIEDEHVNPAVVVGLCGACTRYFTDEPGHCEAFPDGEGIPLEVQTGYIDHRDPVPGDHGIQFHAFPSYGTFFSKSLLKKQATYTGTLICVFLPFDVAARIVDPKGEDLQELHMTLVYIAGQVNKIDVIKAIRAFCAEFDSFEVELQGTAQFTPKPGDPVPNVYLVNSPKLPEFQHHLVDQLMQTGVTPNADYGFVPHVTIRYDGDPLPTLKERIPFTIDTVTLVQNGVCTDFKLDELTKEAAGHEFHGNQWGGGTGVADPPHQFTTVQEADAWANQHLPLHVTLDQLEAVKSYKQDSYFINSSMRGLDVDLDVDEGKQAELIKQAFDEPRNTLAEPVSVYRVVDSRAFGAANFDKEPPTTPNEHGLHSPAVGDVIRDKAFMSTTMASKFAAEWGGNYTMKIDLPAGTPALHLDAPKVEWGESVSEGELLLKANAGIRVTGVEQVPGAAREGFSPRYLIHAEYVG